MSEPIQTGKSLPDLLGSLIGDLTVLFRQEVRLAKAETSETISKTAGALGTIAIGAAILMAALVMLLHAASHFLTLVGIAPHWSTLAVGVVAAGIGAAMLAKGRSAVRDTSLVPSRTVDQLQRDVAAAKEQMR